MLVSFGKGFIMEGEASFKERKHFWDKPQEIIHKIYCTTGISGICDETELDAEVERLTQEQLKSSGWGHKFHGWQRVVPYDESVEIYAEHGWDTEYIPTCEVRLQYIRDWKMDKILKVLTGKQFLQFCKEIDLEPYKVKELTYETHH